MFRTLAPNGSENAVRYAQHANDRAYRQRFVDEYTGGNTARPIRYRSTAWDQEMRNEVVPVYTRRMTARYAGTCTQCGQQFPADTWIDYNVQTRKAAHATCPKAPNTETGIIAARADDLLNEYDALKADQDRKAAAIRKTGAAVMTRKAIYRVHLTGEAKKYGRDFVNVALVPNERYGSVKVSEHRGESIGVVKSDGSFMFWQTVDQNDARVQAIKAAADVILNAADPIEFARAFAVESSQCMRCGDDLLDDASRARLLGPVCVKKWTE